MTAPIRTATPEQLARYAAHKKEDGARWKTYTKDSPAHQAWLKQWSERWAHRWERGSDGKLYPRKRT